MTLNHSKTWPVTTMAVVQLRVSPQGGAYEIIENNAPFEGGKTPKGRDEANFGDNTIAGDCNNDGLVVPLLEKHLEIFTTMSSRRKTTIRTDTVSTILDPAEFDSETNENCGKFLKCQLINQLLFKNTTRFKLNKIFQVKIC